MSESILNALVQLFALISDIHKDTYITGRELEIVRSFLSRHLNSEQVARYMKTFEEQLVVLNAEKVAKDSRQDRKRTTLNAMKILGICEKINQELEQKQKIYVLVQLIDYISLGSEVTATELDFLQTVAGAFYTDETEYANIRSFIIESLVTIPDKKRVLLIDDSREPKMPNIRHQWADNIKGALAFLQIPSTNTYILRYSGTADLYLNGQIIQTDQTYFFDQGSSVRGAGIKTIYYSDVVGSISGISVESKVSLIACDVTFKFRNSDNGIHNLNFCEESGRLVGILGGSGVGKSTTLSILSGTIPPQTGEVRINGYSLYDESEKRSLEGVIGFVPQDDLLIEELTVFQNLYYNAKLCLSNLGEEALTSVVNRTLADFDLEETRDLKVGNPLKKVISGGQRKRLNIALELMREPTILFVDEPTSGLSSVDSEMVMNLLKLQAYKGKLVIVNIHQPNSDIYKMFDRIMIIDKGGYQVFYGNPTEAITYFKRHSHHANPDEDQCILCGNVDTDQVLQIVETKVVDERGRPTRIRKVTPQEWAERLKESGMIVRKMPEKHNELPKNNYSIPGKFRQSLIFFTRDLLAKLADRQYIMISLLGPPLLSLVLAYFTRFASGGQYTFASNENIPSFMFMSVITSLFFGLMVSSEEIVKDRKLLKRESFLNLSWFSYLNSKIMILFIISALQTLSFVIIGVIVLKIKGMTLPYWIVLFTTSCTANLLGLNLSSAFNSVITIYVLIPFFIIPQLLFSGVMVPFDKLNLGIQKPREYVPVIGDVMTARWTFEAMAVKQFRDNEFEKNYFGHNMEIARFNWYCRLVDDLTTDLKYYIAENDDADEDENEEVEKGYKMLKKYILQLSSETGMNPGEWLQNLSSAGKDASVASAAGAYLNSLKESIKDMRTNERKRKEQTEIKLRKSLGPKRYEALQSASENRKLKEFILDEMQGGKLVMTAGLKKFPKTERGYLKATSPIGRAHFYAPYKFIGKKKLNTFSFNLIVVWFVTMLLFIALYYKVLFRLVNYTGNLRIQKPEN